MMDYLFVAFLYADALMLQHFGIIHPRLWAWALPLWIFLATVVSKAIAKFSEKAPVAAVPIMMVWIYIVIELFFKMEIV